MGSYEFIIFTLVLASFFCYISTVLIDDKERIRNVIEKTLFIVVITIGIVLVFKIIF